MKKGEVTARPRASFRAAEPIRTISLSEIIYNGASATNNELEEVSRADDQARNLIRRLSSHEFDGKVDELARFCGVQNCPDVLVLSQTSETLESNFRRSEMRNISSRSNISRAGAETQGLVQSILLPIDELKSRAGAAPPPAATKVATFQEITNQPQPHRAGSQVNTLQPPGETFQGKEGRARRQPIQETAANASIQQPGPAGRRVLKENMFTPKIDVQNTENSNHSGSDIQVSKEKPPHFESAHTAKGKPKPSLYSSSRLSENKPVTDARKIDSTLSAIFPEVAQPPSPSPHRGDKELPKAMPRRSSCFTNAVLSKKDGQPPSKASIGSSLSIVRYASREGKSSEGEGEGEGEGLEIAVTKKQLQNWTASANHRRDLALDFSADKESRYTYYDYEEELGRLRDKSKDMKDALEILDSKVKVRVRRKDGMLRNFRSAVITTNRPWWKEIFKVCTCTER